LPKRTPPPAPVSSRAAARSAGLRYVSDEAPGIIRTHAGRSFRYRTSAGRAVTDRAALARIQRLAIPPAWTDVWICRHANGHIQAVGRDARGRKQYRYHPEWRAARDADKYSHLLAFGRALPKIRRRVAHDLAVSRLSREKILAAMVRLLETTLMRIGNEEYARTNGSTGLTTLRDRHVEIAGETLRFEFTGKSGKHHRIALRDRQLAGIVRRAQDLPGQELFQYIDADGRRRKVHSEDVNAYLRGIAGAEFSAKDFRTWAGTVLAAVALHQLPPGRNKAGAKKNLVRAIESVAAQLGNTPAICRKCYIHPAVFESYLAGTTITPPSPQSGAASGRNTHGALSGSEKAVLELLKKSLRAPRPTLISTLRRSVVLARRRRKPPPTSARASGGGAATKSRRRKSKSSAHRSRR
jgi:DNA topoisomerase I